MSKTTNVTKTKSFGDVIRSKLKKDADLQDRVDIEAFNIDVATLIHDARKSENLTQVQLAARVGTSQSVIARMEDADYDGHSLKMLKKIGEALGRRVGIEFYKKPAPFSIKSGRSHEIVWPEADENAEFSIETEIIT